MTRSRTAAIRFSLALWSRRARSRCSYNGSQASPWSPRATMISAMRSSARSMRSAVTGRDVNEHRFTTSESYKSIPQHALAVIGPSVQREGVHSALAENGGPGVQNRRCCQPFRTGRWALVAGDRYFVRPLSRRRAFAIVVMRRGGNDGLGKDVAGGFRAGTECRRWPAYKTAAGYGLSTDGIAALKIRGMNIGTRRAYSSYSGKVCRKMASSFLARRYCKRN